MVRGEIYFVDLSPRSGSEQSGHRPCVIVSHAAFTENPRWQSVTVVPLTTADRWQRFSPTTVRFEAGESNLPRACAALAHQITTLDKSKVVTPPVGAVTGPKLLELEEAIRNYLVL